jgi:hypothetical protein
MIEYVLNVTVAGGPNAVFFAMVMGHVTDEVN